MPHSHTIKCARAVEPRKLRAQFVAEAANSLQLKHLRTVPTTLFSAFLAAEFDLATARAQLPKTVALQGNLDPVLLNTTPEVVRRESIRLLETMRGARGHIFNLGHGIMPAAKIECMEALVGTVTGWKY